VGTVGILIEDWFDEREVVYPFYRVREAGHEPLLIGPRAGTFHGKSSFTLEAAAAAPAVEARTLSGLIVPGGFAPDRMRRDPSMLALVRDLDRAGRPLGAICHGGWVLVSAGVARGRRLTGFSSIRDDLANAGATYLEDRVVVDRNLVTAQHADDLPAFVAAFLSLLDRA
jgi:protease I